MYSRLLIGTILIITVIISVCPDLFLSFSSNSRDFSYNYYAFPPLDGNVTLAGKYLSGGINVYRYYSIEPAPMGIGFFGIGPDGPCIVRTSQVMARVSIGSLDISSSLYSGVMTYQFNSVMVYSSSGKNYSLWVQNVARIYSDNNSIEFIDNVWNFTSPNANVTGLRGNGNIIKFSSQTFYYYVASDLPGSMGTYSYPFTFYMLSNVTINSLGQPEILLWYNDGQGWINYDNITVTNVVDASNVSFLIDGYEYADNGLFYDEELVMGGPGGGLCTYVFSANIQMSIYYWNGNNFQESLNTFNFGSDTAEKVNNVKDILGQSVNGQPYAAITSGSTSLGYLWNSEDVSSVTINSDVSNGSALIFPESVSYKDTFGIPPLGYIGDNFTVVVYPENYSILIYKDGVLSGESFVCAIAGKTELEKAVNFSVSISNNITVFQGFSNYLNLTVNAVGILKIYLSIPSFISYTPIYSSFDQGTEIVSILLHASKNSPPGLYNGVVYVKLQDGQEIVKNIEISIEPRIFTVNLDYIFKGNKPSQIPEISLIFPNGTKENVTEGIYKVPYGTEYEISQEILDGNIRWITNHSIEGYFTSSSSLIIIYYEQYKVDFGFKIMGEYTSYTPQIVYYLGRQEVTNPGIVWADYNSSYTYSKLLNGSNSTERWISYNNSGFIDGFNVTAVYYNQFYVNVNSPIKLYAKVSNSNISFVSGWYNYSEAINVENISYYITNTERILIIKMVPSNFIIVNNYTQFYAYPIIQFYVNISQNIPLKALVNGTETILTSNWYNNGTRVLIENSTYTMNFVRFLVLAVYPYNFIVNRSINVHLSLLKQYYVTVNSGVPLEAYINSTKEPITSGWYNSGTTIDVINNTYYSDSYTRFVILDIINRNITVNNPSNITVMTEKEFLVNINNVSQWYPASSRITLNANVPFYEVGSFKGTYNVPIGYTITVNGPIKEELVTGINILFVLGIMVAVLAIIVLIIIKRK